MFHRTLITLGLLAIASGCSSAQRNVPLAATAPAAVVQADDFQAIWSAVDATSRELLFTPAREDRRIGLYRTEPMVSSQWFEPWRRELRTADAVLESSLGTMRRTVTVNITQNPDNTFSATPSVRVERFALSERRITTSASYRSVFRERRRGTYGSAETDAGMTLPDSYWYDVGTDPALETYLADQISRKLGTVASAR